MKYAIVTGVSKGLGASVANYLLESGIHVFGISRTGNDGLYVTATENNVEYEHLLCDIGNKESLIETTKMIQEQLKEKDIQQLYLVNNAAVVEPIKRATEINFDELSKHYQINVLAPIYLMNTFLKECVEANFIGVNITSGAAERPIHGWSAYGSSKASLNMYTKTIALEQASMKNDHKIIAFSPGIMDTDMQTQIRDTDVEQFADVDTFKNYKQLNILTDTDAVASVLVDIMTNEVNIENGKIYSVQDYL